VRFRRTPSSLCYRNQGMLSATAFTVNPQTDRDYAWVTVNIQQSGRVTMTAYGFDDQFDATKTLAYYVLR